MYDKYVQSAEFIEATMINWLICYTEHISRFQLQRERERDNIFDLFIDVKYSISELVQLLFEAVHQIVWENRSVHRANWQIDLVVWWLEPLGHTNTLNAFLPLVLKM